MANIIFNLRRTADRNIKRNVAASKLFSKLFKVFAAGSLSLFAMLAFGQQSPVHSPELVIRAPSYGKGRIQRLSFDANGSLVVLGIQESRVLKWNIDTNEGSEIFGGEMETSRIGAAQFVGNQEYLITYSNYRDIFNKVYSDMITVWDVKKHQAIKRIPTKNWQLFPLTCHSSGACAWLVSEEQGNSIHVQNLIKGSGALNLPLGDDIALDLDISPDGKRLAVAVNRAVIRVWSLPDGKEMTPLQLEAGSNPGSLTDSAVPKDSLALEIPGFFVPRVRYSPGRATSVRFSPDGKLLVAANETALHVFEDYSSRMPLLLRGHKGKITGLAFDARGRIFSAGEDKTIRAWEPRSSNGIIVAQLSKTPMGLSVHPNNKVIAVSLPGWQAELWDVERQKSLANLNFLENRKGWVATTPEGLFETSEGAWRYASWRFHDQPKTRLPIELFYRNFFHPGLVADLLAGRRVAAPTPIDPEALEVPQVKIEVIETKFEQTGAVQAIDQITKAVRFRIEARQASKRSGVFNLKLAHNDLVVICGRKMTVVVRAVGDKIL